MLNKLRPSHTLPLLTALLLGLVLSLVFTSLSPTTDTIAATNTNPFPTAGKVTAKGQDNFTLLIPPTYSVTFKVTSATKFIRDGKPSYFSELQVGMQISMVTQSDSTGKQYYAVQVTLPPTPVTCYTSVAMTAKVATKTANGFTVNWGNGIVSNTFLVSAETKFYQDDKLVAFEQMQVGQMVTFYTRNCSDGKLTTLSVVLPATPKPTPTPAPTCNTSVEMTGKVDSKTANSFSIAWGNGIVSKYAVNADTKFYQNNLPATFSQMQIGKYVSFYSRNCTGGNFTALSVKLL